MIFLVAMAPGALERVTGMDSNDWWERLSALVLETKYNITRAGTSGDNNMFIHSDKKVNLKENEIMEKIETGLRRDSTEVTHENVPPVNKLVKHTKNIIYEDKLADYFFNHFSQESNDRIYIKKLLADIKDNLNNIIFFNENEKKRLDILETEVFIKNQMNKPEKCSNIHNVNIVKSIEKLEESIKLMIEKLSCVVSSNESIIKRLDEINNFKDNKLQFDSGDMVNRSKKPTTPEMTLQKSQYKLITSTGSCLPRPKIHYDIQQSPLPNEYLTFKTHQQLIAEYETKRRQLQLLANEGFASPDIRYKGNFSQDEE